MIKDVIDKFKRGMIILNNDSTSADLHFITKALNINDNLIITDGLYYRCFKNKLIKIDITETDAYVISTSIFIDIIDKYLYKTKVYDDKNNEYYYIKKLDTGYIVSFTKPNYYNKFESIILDEIKFKPNII